MNVDDNHLVRRELLEELRRIDPLKAAAYEPIPQGLERAAEQKLRGRQEAVVSKTSGGKLSRHAVARRNARRAMEKATRKRNRPR